MLTSPYDPPPPPVSIDFCFPPLLRSPDLPKRAHRKNKSVPGQGFLIIEGGVIVEFRDPNSLIAGGFINMRLTFTPLLDTKTLNLLSD